MMSGEDKHPSTSDQLVEQIMDKMQGHVADAFKAFEKNNSPAAQVAAIVKQREDFHEQQRKKDKAFYLGTAIAILIIAISVLSIITYRQVREKQILHDKTEAQLQAILDAQHDEQLHGKIVLNLTAIIDTHRSHIKKTWSVGSWKKDYSKQELNEMAQVILRSWRYEKITPEEIYSIAAAETYFMYWKTSEDGAQGLMQTMPERVAEVKSSKWYYKDLNPFDPSDNIIIATEFMSDLIMSGKRWHDFQLKDQGGWNILDTACSYNGGPDYYSKFLNKKHSGLKVKLYDETKTFKAKVEFYYKNYTKDPPDFTVVWTNS